MKRPKLLQVYAVISLQAILIGLELVASQLTHSLILLADAYHTLYAIMTQLVMIISIKISNETTLKNTFGWARIEVVGMLVNMTFIAALSFSVLVEGIQQVVHASHEIAHPTNHLILLAFGAAGLVTNALCIAFTRDLIKLKFEEKPTTSDRKESSSWRSRKAAKQTLELKLSSSDAEEKLLSEDIHLQVIKASKENSHKKLVLMETLQSHSWLQWLLGDFSSSCLTLVCGVIVLLTGDSTTAKLSDPILGIIAAIALTIAIYPTIKSTGMVLLQTVPQHIDVDLLKQKLLKEFPSIINVHELHVWCLTKSQVISTCHVVLEPTVSDHYGEFSTSLRRFFLGEGISLSTVQPEFKMPGYDSNGCLIPCSKSESCEALSCCKGDDTCEVVVGQEIK